MSNCNQAGAGHARHRQYILHMMSIAKHKWGCIWCILGIVVGAAVAPAWGQDPNLDCQQCHPGMTLEHTLKGSATPQLTDQLVKRKGPAHESLACVDCHSGAPQETQSGELPARPCLDCHSESLSRPGGTPVHAIDLLHKGGPRAPTCVNCHGYHGIVGTDSLQSPVTWRRIPQLCGRCHINDELSGEIPQVGAYLSSVHGQIAMSGSEDLRPAVCTDCHGIHMPRNGRKTGLAPHRPEVPDTCARCHEAEYREYTTSVHGVALRAGEEAAAICTDCHREHEILFPASKQSPVYAANIVETCSSCHGDSGFVRLHHLPPARVSSYRHTYHGIANQYGDLKVANCVSCHGAHHILLSSDSQSTTSPEHLAATCGNCHSGTSDWMALGGIHVATTGFQATVLAVVGLLYRLFVFGMTAAFLGYIFLDLWAHWRLARSGELKRREEHIASLPDPEESWLLRLTRSERIQHYVLMSSFAVLVISGVALLWPQTLAAKLIVAASGGMVGRAIIHRVAAVVLVAVGLYHVVWVVGTRRGRESFRRILPAWADVGNLWVTVKFLLGRSASMARFGHFSFIEKFEYWAVAWGMAVMGVTGVIMMFTDWSLRFLPKWVWDVSRIVHGWEGVLAALAIIIWHHYHVMYKLGPMNMAGLTGRLSAEQFVSEHPLEYEAAAGLEPGAASLDSSGVEGISDTSLPSTGA